MLNNVDNEEMKQNESHSNAGEVPMEAPTQEVEMDSTIPLSTPSQNTMVDFRKELQDLVLFCL